MATSSSNSQMQRLSLQKVNNHPAFGCADALFRSLDTSKCADVLQPDQYRNIQQQISKPKRGRRKGLAGFFSAGDSDSCHRGKTECHRIKSGINFLCL